jgi:diketogulonate reductase-like aldo/keto reductase
VSVQTGAGADRELEGGGRMPALGLGVWQMAAGPETEQAVEWALEAGYRHIDTASYYRNEQSVGAALGRSGLPREEVFVTTKLMPAHPSAERELQRSLERLGLEYVDLYLIHFPVPGMTRRHWKSLQSLQEQGLARAIGVSNFGRERLRKLQASGSRKPALNQVQLSPLHYRRRLAEYCAEEGIVLEAYSPLERGQALANPAIVAVAERVGRTPAQVMLRWAIQRGAVVIPKSSNRDRIRSNAEVFDFELDADSMRDLDGLDTTGGTANARG